MYNARAKAEGLLLPELPTPLCTASCTVLV